MHSGNLHSKKHIQHVAFGDWQQQARWSNIIVNYRFAHFALAWKLLSRQCCHNIKLAPAFAHRLVMARPRSTDSGLYVLESLVTYRLTRIADMLVRAAGQVYSAQHGVSLTELRLLATLGRHRALSVNEASRLTGIDKAWVSRSLAGLVKRKLAKRHRHLSDSRISLLSLTRSGKAKVQQMVALAATTNERLLAGLGKKDRIIFDKILSVLQAQVENLLAHPVEGADGRPCLPHRRSTRARFPISRFSSLTSGR